MKLLPQLGTPARPPTLVENRPDEQKGSRLARPNAFRSFDRGRKCEALTLRLGKLLQLGPASRVLDVASGQGTSAFLLAQRFGCQVVGIDYGALAIQQAATRARERGLDHLVTFQTGDAEQLPVPSASFDALLCECAFCTFPNKTVAAAEFQRVLKPGGRVGVSDLTRRGGVPTYLLDGQVVSLGNPPRAAFLARLSQESNQGR